MVLFRLAITPFHCIPGNHTAPYSRMFIPDFKVLLTFLQRPRRRQTLTNVFWASWDEIFFFKTILENSIKHFQFLLFLPYWFLDFNTTFLLFIFHVQEPNFSIIMIITQKLTWFNSFCQSKGKICIFKLYMWWRFNVWDIRRSWNWMTKQKTQLRNSLREWYAFLFRFFPLSYFYFYDIIP